MTFQEIRASESTARHNEPAAGKPRVMLFIDTFSRGGNERQFLHVLRQLDRGEYELVIGCLHKRGAFLDEVCSQGMPIVEFPIGSLFGFHTARRFWQLVRFLRRNHFAILHAFDFYSELFALPAARMAGVPVLLAARGELRDLRNPLQRRAIGIAYGLATRIVANSEASFAEAPREPGRVVFIPNSIDLDLFRPSIPSTEVRRNLGLGDSAPLIGLLAMLRPEKDVGTFLRAAAHVSKQIPEARFLVIGDGSERQALERLSAELGLSGSALFLGDQSHVENLLASLDIAVLSSVTESMPNAVLEAMAMGRPVVATRAGGTQELVRDGETGYLVPVRDPEAMAEKLLTLLRDPEQRLAMGRAGRARVEREFSGTRMREELRTLYSSTLRAHRPAARILQIGNYPPPACGWSIHTEAVHHALMQRGVDARVLDIGPGRDVPKPGCIPVGNAFDYAVKLATHRMGGFRFQPHVNGDSWKGYALALAAVLLGRVTGKPAVLMFHAGHEQIFFPRSRGFWFHAFRLLFRASGEIICNSEQVRQAILGYGISADKIHAIFSVDYAAEKNPIPAPPAVASFLRMHEPRLCCYALFRPEFTMEALFEAFSGLRRDYPKAGLVICGPAETPREAKEQMRRFGIESSVLITGNLPHAEFLATLRSSDLFIRTAVRDGLCASVIEALTLGVPVVAANNGTRPCSVMTYQPGSAADLKLKLLTVLSDIKKFRLQTKPPEIRASIETEVSLLMRGRQIAQPGNRGHSGAGQTKFSRMAESEKRVQERANP